MNRLLGEREKLKRDLIKIDQRIESCKIILNGLSKPELERFADALYDIAVDAVERKE